MKAQAFLVSATGAHRFHKKSTRRSVSYYFSCKHRATSKRSGICQARLPAAAYFTQLQRKQQSNTSNVGPECRPQQFDIFVRTRRLLGVAVADIR